MSTEKTCPDCNAAMGEIMIIDRSRMNELVSADGSLSYALPDEKKGFLGAIPARGTIKSLACTKCGRIVLYAVHSKKE